MTTPQEQLDMEEILSNVMAMLKAHAMTDFEAGLWHRIMEQTSREKFQRYLESYVLSPQAKFGPPTPGNAATALGLALDPETAYAQIEIAVRTFGPYQLPEIHDPVLLMAIKNMGGWAAINEQMPGAANSFEQKAFKDRFTSALTLAINQVRIEGMAVEPLRAIGDAKTYSDLQIGFSRPALPRG